MSCPVTRAVTMLPGAASRSSAHPGELLGTAVVGSFHEDPLAPAVPGIEVAGQPFGGQAAQHRRARLAGLSRNLRHPRRRRAGPLRIGEDVEPGETCFADEGLGLAEHRVGLGREARD